MLAGMNPVKSAAVAVPKSATFTVWFSRTALDTVAVTVIAGLPVSVLVTGETERFTVGKSLSVIATSPVVVVPRTIPLEGFEIVKVPVSLPSTSASSLILTVNEPVVRPAGIVMIAGISPVKSAAVAVPKSATFTVWFSRTALDAVAVTVIAGLPVSLLVTGETERLTEGKSLSVIVSVAVVFA